MELRPVISALGRNKVGALLIALQMAVTLAILCNALYIVQQRLALIARPSGVDEEASQASNCTSRTETWRNSSCRR